MKIVVYFCLVIAAILPAVTVQREMSIGLDEKLIPRYWNRTIRIRNLQIPENSWWKGSRTIKNDLGVAIKQVLFGILSYLFITPSQMLSSFDTVEYLKDIPAGSPIQVDYAVQYLDSSGARAQMYSDSVLLCGTTAEETRNAGILVLVRELLGIPKGCPIFAGEKRYVDYIYLPLTRRSSFFNRNFFGEHIKIFTNMWEDNSYSAQMLFSGEFEFVDS